MDEAGSELAAEVWDKARTVASSRMAYPEARAAIGKAQRLGRIDEAGAKAAVELFEDLHAELAVIDVDEELARTAGDLAARHSLRAYDAVHLACAKDVEDPRMLLVTWDRDLAEAALACELPVVP